ncbi:AAA family ATPase [Nocardia sp. NPDC052566]|uniref:helix-turn-helix transcriptional regulator n=1 Tax=Nocardia sp. NPDC052566 TaxID=3364330 RepID=UPI0037C95630
MLVERDRELVALSILLDRAREGSGGVALISGDVASGKTSLLNSFCDNRILRDVLLLRATGSIAEQELRMGIISQLFQAHQIPQAVRERVAYGLKEHTDWDVKETVHRELFELSKERAIVIAVDDIDFADESSLNIISYLHRRIRSTGILLILIERTAPGTAASAFSTELTRDPDVRQLPLFPLSRKGIERLLARSMPEEAAQRQAVSIRTLSEGNPLVVQALIADQLREAHGRIARPSAELLVGNAYRQAVLHMLHRIDPQLVRAVRALAVLAGRASVTMLGHVFDIEPAAAVELLGRLNAIGITSAGRFRHPAARAAVMTGIPEEERCWLHSRAAISLYNTGASAEETARHVVAAGVCDEPWAVQLLTQAADQGLARDDVEWAVVCLEIAWQGCSDECRRPAILAKLARVRWLASPAAAVRYLPELVEAAQAGRLGIAESWWLVRALAWHGKTAEATAVLARLNAVGQHDSDTLIAHRLGVRWLANWYPRLISAVTDAAGSHSIADEDPTARAVAALSTAAIGDPSAVDAAEQLLQGSRVTDSSLEAVMCALQALICADRPDRVIVWCRELLDDAQRRLATTWQAILLSFLANAELRLGNLVEAERDARAALKIWPAENWGTAIGAPLSSLIMATSMMGKVDDAAAALRQPVPSAMASTHFWLRYIYARGYAYFATDRLQAALADFQTVGYFAETWRADIPLIFPWRSDAAQVHARLGRAEHARELVDTQMSKPGSARPRVLGHGLRALALVSGPKQRIPLLQEAVRRFEECGDRYHLAKALVDLSDACRQAGELNTARAVTRRALQLSKAVHAEALYESLHEGEQDGADGGPDTGHADLESLSAAELRVASLAALGHTNREISHSLFITVSTVEQHLTRVYRKLNVAKRTDLPETLGPVHRP